MKSKTADFNIGHGAIKNEVLYVFKRQRNRLRQNRMFFLSYLVELVEGRKKRTRRKGVLKTTTLV